MVEQRLGRKEQAVAAYERAVQLGERRVLVFEQLISLLDCARSGPPKWIDTWLGWKRTFPFRSGWPKWRWSSKFVGTDPEQAVEIARTRVTQRPDDPLAQLWLSRLLMITGKVQEAEAPLRRTTELAPTDARFLERPLGLLCADEQSRAD